MTLLKMISGAACCAGLCLMALATSAANAQSQFPAQKESSWVARDFRFHSGQAQILFVYAIFGEAVEAKFLRQAQGKNRLVRA